MVLTAVVVGGGIGGLCTAIGLRKAGWHVTVLERAAELAAPGAGITLWPNALRGLDELGVGDAVAPHLRTQQAGGLRDLRGRRLTHWDGGNLERRFGKPLAGIHRASLITALCTALPDPALRTGLAVTGADAAGVVYGHSGVIAEADLVVGADGINSAVRNSAWQHPPGSAFSGVTAFRAVTDVDGVPRLGTVWGPGAEFGVVPLTDGKVYWWVSLAGARAREPVEPGTFLRARLRDWPADVRQLIAHTDPTTILRHDIDVLAAPLRSYSNGHIALLGDAAHAMTPFLGQGGCQAIEDAVVLAAHLAECADDPAGIPAAVVRYDADRRPRTQALVRASARMGKVGHLLRNPLAVAARNTLITLVPSAVALRGMDTAADWTPPTIRINAAGG